MAFRDSTVAQFNGTTSLTGTAPTGVASGDRLLAWVVQDNTGHTHTAATGWDATPLAQLTNTGPDGQLATLFEKKNASGSDSYDFTSSVSMRAIVIVGAWSGRDNSAAATIQSTSNNSSNSSPISVALTGVTAATNDDLAYFAHLDQTSADGAWAWSALSGFTEREDSFNDGWISTTLWTNDAVSAGATGTLTATATLAAASAGFSGVVVALPVSGGGGAANYTLTCDAGAYAISGQDATLTYVAGAANYSLTCDAGTYVIAGQDAALNYVPGAGTVNYTLTCDAGAYTIAGQDANLIVAHTLVCDAGAYVIAGQDATLTYVAGAANYSLTCDAGAYVLSGQDATLRRGYQLTCEAGAYTLSGQDATLTYVDGSTPINYTLTCDAGAYVINGQDAMFAFSGATTPRRHASAWKKRYYLIKGQKYLLDDRELAVKISEMLADISTVQRISKGKKKQLSPQYWAAIEALITEKVFYVEDNEDDEEILLMF